MDALKKFTRLLGLSLVLVFAQNALAACQGTLHFMAPDSWGGKFYVATSDKQVLAKATKNEATGYYDYDLANVEAKAYDSTFALYTVRTDGTIEYVFKNVWQRYSQG